MRWALRGLLIAGAWLLVTMFMIADINRPAKASPAPSAWLIPMRETAGGPNTPRIVVFCDTVAGNLVYFAAENRNPLGGALAVAPGGCRP